MSALTLLRKQLLTQQHRQLVILSGSEFWQRQQLDALFEEGETVFWISPKAECAISPQLNVPAPFCDLGYEFIDSKRLPYYLGQEISGAVIDVKQGVSADSLGIVAGMITAGGLFILLTPDVQEWKTLVNPENSRFLNTPLTIKEAKSGFTEHLIDCWQQSNIIWLEEAKPLTQPVTSNTPPNTTIQLPSHDQQHAIEQINNVAFGHRKRPLVITADRGRGKSSVLGMAAVDCLVKGKKQIAITANRLDQASAAFKHAILAIEELLKNGVEIELTIHKPGLVEFSYLNQLKRIQFFAPDALILNPSSADLLFIDEAAHLPTPVLIELLLRHHRLVFATTLHGYEGSGRGFELRFKKQLNLHTPDWKNCLLQQPIRWAAQDPLEQAMNHALLLDAEMANLDNSVANNLTCDALIYEQITTQQLLENNDLMRSLFGLLVQAHYQTSPNDLQQLLNAPNIKIFTASYQHNQQTKVLGAVLCVEEGKISKTANRAHGHLVPQLLTKHYAQQDFLMLSTLRIMRIAVHPKYQRIGIGKQLIAQLERSASTHRVDYISSSFGSSDELLPFWFDQQFWPLHVGAKRDKASGCHNMVVAKPLTAMGRQALSLIQTRFQEQFPHLLLESLPYLPASQVWPIVQTFRFKKRHLGYEKALINYQNGSRPYESISHKLWEWSLQCAAKVQQSSGSEQAIWCDKILKKQSWQEVAHQHHLAGRKGVEEKLKSTINQWMSSPTIPFKRHL